MDWVALAEATVCALFIVGVGALFVNAPTF